MPYSLFSTYLPCLANMHYGAIPGFVCVLQASNFERNVRITMKNYVMMMHDRMLTQINNQLKKQIQLSFILRMIMEHKRG
jgi:hypothetical protein